mgnify:CR=1 FL=1
MIDFCRKDKLLTELALFLLIFTLAAPMFNAVNSIVMAISVIFVILQYKRINLKAIPLPIVYSIFLFISSLFISSFFIGDKKSIDYAFKFLYWMLPFFVVFYGFKLCKNINIPLYSFTMALLVSAGAVLYQYYFLDKLRPGGLYFQPNHFASMMDILFPFATMFVLKNLYECKNKIIGVILFLPIIIGIYALFLSGSRGGLIGIFIGFLLCVICFFLRKLKLTSFILGLSTIIVLFAGSMIVAYNYMPDLFQRSYDNERLLLIESSYNMWNDHKLFGIGLDNWEEEYNDKYKLPQAREKLDMPHNILAFFFSTTGLIGGMGYIIFVCGIFIFLINALRECRKRQTIFVVLAMLWALFAINIHGMVDVGLNNKFVMRLFSGTLGLTAAYLCLREQKGDYKNDRSGC